MAGVRTKVALVYGNLPTVEEIDQFQLIKDQCDLTVISSESICGYLTQNSWFQDLTCIALPDHDDNTTYLPGLEKVLGDYEIVIVKERLGVYAYQAVKSKWRNKFRLVVWVDNATPFPGEDIKLLRTVRQEVTNAADAFIVQSDAVASALAIEGVEAQRIIHFNPYVAPRVTRNAKNRANALTTLGLSDTDFVIAHFGQIEWEEALFDLVSSVKSLQTIDKSLSQRIKIVFCGIGSFASELRDRLVKLGLDRQAIYVAPSRDAWTTVVGAADCLYYANNSARDRLEGEPYRILTAMTHGIPVLAPRNPIVEDLVGKHRVDFCNGSISSLANAIKKAATGKALTHDIVAKNKSVVDKQYSAETVTQQMQIAIASIKKQTATVDIHALDHQVLEAEVLVQSKQYLAAIDLIEGIFKVSGIPSHHQSNLLRLIGDCFTKLGDGDAGKTAYVQAIDIDPYSSKAYIGLGTVALTRNNHDMAVLHFQKAVSLAPEDEMANLGLGLAFQGMGELNEANRWVVKSLEINPDNTAAIFTLVQLGNERKRYDDVETILSQYIERHPHDHNMIYTLAAIKHTNSQTAGAKALIDRILAVDPYDDKALSLSKQLARVAKVVEKK